MPRLLDDLRSRLAPLPAALATFLILQIGFNFPAYTQMIGFSAAETFPRDFAEAAASAPASAVLPPSLPVLGGSAAFPGVSTATEVLPPDFRVVIPRLAVNAPVVETSPDFIRNQDWVGLEKAMQKDLEKGVVRYPGSSEPNGTGNLVLTGHSSYYPWAPGTYKDIFALLPQLAVGDEVFIVADGRKVRYEVTATDVVLPSQVDVLRPTTDQRVTLITCVPIGTDWKRQIVTAVAK